MKMDYIIRQMKKNEYPLLNDFLYEAIYIPDGVEPPPKSVINSLELQEYIVDLVSRYAPYEAYPYIEPNVRFSRIRLPTKRIVHLCPIYTDIYPRFC